MTSKIDSVLRDIQTSLNSQDYLYYSTVLSEEEFDLLINMLGSMVLTKAIKIDENSTSFYSNPAEFRLHTDSAVSQIIGMYCFDSGEVPVATEIVTVEDIFEFFTSKEIRQLKNLYFNDPFKKEIVPFLIGNKADYQIYYTDWMIIPSKDINQDNLVKKLKNYVKLKSEKTLKIFLQPGQSLFMMNRKLLHGRGAIDKYSTRSLKRVWLDKANHLHVL